MIWISLGSTLFPYTTLFRSLIPWDDVAKDLAAAHGGAAVVDGDLGAGDIDPHRVRRRERSEEHTSELQSPDHLVCRLLLEKKKHIQPTVYFDLLRKPAVVIP